MKKQLVICFLVVLMNIILCSCSSNISDNMNLDDISNSFSQDEEKDDNDISDVGESIDVEKSTDVNTVIDFDPQVVKEVLDIDISGEYVYVPQVCDFEVPVEIADLGGDNIGGLYSNPTAVEEALTDLYLYYHVSDREYFELEKTKLIDFLEKNIGYEFEYVSCRLDFYLLASKDYKKALFKIKNEENKGKYYYFTLYEEGWATGPVLLENYYYQDSNEINQIKAIASKYYKDATINGEFLSPSSLKVQIYILNSGPIDYIEQQRLYGEMYKEYEDMNFTVLCISVLYLDSQYEMVIDEVDNYYIWSDVCKILYDAKVIKDCIFYDNFDESTEQVSLSDRIMLDDDLKWPYWIN